MNFSESASLLEIGSPVNFGTYVIEIYHISRGICGKSNLPRRILRLAEELVINWELK